MINTIIIYDSCGENPLRFYNLEGDYSHLNNIYANGSEEYQKVDELWELVKNAPFTNYFPGDLFIKDTKVIVAGFYP